MQLSRRLCAAADMVTFGNRVADIGCDHAYVPIYLAEHDISPYVIAMDVNQGPIDRARDNIMKFGLADKIETRKSDGLEKLREGEADTLLIAGMGGALTIEILTKRLDLLASVKELVLQPQSEIYKVRHMLQEQSFLIISENMVKEDGKYYVVMKAVPSNIAEQNTEILKTMPSHTNKMNWLANSLVMNKRKQDYELYKAEHYHYGRLLLEQKHPVLLEFLYWNYGLCEGIMNNLSQEQTENSKIRQQEIQERIKLINKGLKYYT